MVDRGKSGAHYRAKLRLTPSMIDSGVRTLSKLGEGEEPTELVFSLLYDAVSGRSQVTIDMLSAGLNGFLEANPGISLRTRVRNIILRAFEVEEESISRLQQQ